jgi:hypothetical protein
MAGTYAITRDFAGFVALTIALIAASEEPEMTVMSHLHSVEHFCRHGPMSVRAQARVSTVRKELPHV